MIFYVQKGVSFIIEENIFYMLKQPFKKIYLANKIAGRVYNLIIDNQIIIVKNDMTRIEIKIDHTRKEYIFSNKQK